MNKKLVASTGLISAILASVIYIEGRYTNDPDDPGGQTKYGITERVAREYGYTGKMTDLTLDEANDIYTLFYVNQPHFNYFIDISPAIAHKLIDAGINVGTARVTLWLQHVLNILSRGGMDYAQIKEDGVIGDNTVNAYKALEKKRGKVKACQLVLKALDGYQSTYYMSLEDYSKYLVGWIDKRVENIPLDQCKDYNLVLPLNTINKKDESK